ncbi:MAG: DUF6057 family protein [Bacteroidales bacterium]|nr:DUF6057 family protein [Bacteroidales bacterium]
MRGIGQNRIDGLLILLCCIIMYAYVNANLFYQLCHMEHRQLFMMDFQTVVGSWCMVGGFARWVSSFLIQFFSIPFLNVALFILPCVLIVVSGKHLFKATSLSIPLFSTAAILLLTAAFEATDSFSPIVATCLVMACFVGLGSRGSGWFVATLLPVWFLSGISVLLYCALGLCCLLRPSSFTGRRFIVLGSLVVAILALFVQLSSADAVAPPIVLYVSWIVIVAIPFLLRLTCMSSHIGLACCWLCCVASMGFMAWQFECAHNTRRNQGMYLLNHLCCEGQWSEVIDILYRHQPLGNQCYLNYAYMALANTDRLDDEAVNFTPYNIFSLLVGNNDGDADVYMLQSDVLYTIGAIGQAHEAAQLCVKVSTQGMGVQQLLRLIETNLIMGRYDEAEQLIGKLGRTWGYRKQADAFRKLLRRDELIAHDACLGWRQKSWMALQGGKDGIQWIEYIPVLAKADKSNHRAATYAKLFYVFSHDKRGLDELLESLSQN